MFNGSKIRVSVSPTWGYFKEVHIIRTEDSKICYATQDEQGAIQWNDLIEGMENPRPFFRMEPILFEEFINALNEVAPPIKKEVVDAELKATTRHLDDMRKLVFSKIPSIPTELENK